MDEVCYCKEAAQAKSIGLIHLSKNESSLRRQAKSHTAGISFAACGKFHSPKANIIVQLPRAVAPHLPYHKAIKKGVTASVMSWFNYYGLAIMAVIMVPNILFAATHKEGFANACQNKTVEILEQVGRYGCFALMIFNIPHAGAHFWFEGALIVYLTVNGALCLAYLFFWWLCGSRKGRLRALSLSILPSAVFLFCGIMLAYIPLLIFAVLFAVNHILLSYKNAVAEL